jgi:tyrosine-protein phosphatase YwqE
MFFLNKLSKSPYTDFSQVKVDMHSHLIPGIDDGAATISDSVFLMTQLQEMGFTCLFTTPHSFEEVYPNSPETLLQGRRDLDNFIPDGIQLEHSFEYYLDEKFKTNLQNKHLIALPGSRLLVEFSQVSLPLNLEKQIKTITDNGYVPIIGHPERYLFLQGRLDYLAYLKSLGVELQLNALSLTNYYGKDTNAFAKKLVKSKLIDFIGTDLHHADQIGQLRNVPASPYYADLVDSGMLKNQRLLEDW